LIAFSAPLFVATAGGVVYTCGENSYHQLGHQPPPPRLLAPAPVGGRGTGGLKLPPAVGVAAGRYHSIFWTEETLYTWGLNAGQLGHLKVSASSAFCFYFNASNFYRYLL
jgi:alpha-tubulin suppressor-like RCC1 family protein